MLFKDKLKNFRKENNITQEELASKLFLSRTLISKWENGVLYPTPETIERLGEIMNVDINYLISNEESKMISLRINSKNNIAAFEKILYIISIILISSGITLLVIGFTFPQNLQAPEDIYNSVNTVTVICFIMKILGGIMSLISVILVALTKFTRRK